MEADGISRSDFLKAVVAGAAALALPAGASAQQTPDKPAITADDLKAFLKLADLRMSDAEIEEAIRTGVVSSVQDYAELRKAADDYSLVPLSVFQPIGSRKLKGSKIDAKPRMPRVKRPKADDDLAFASVAELAHLLKTRQVTSVELTELAVARLKRFGPGLACVVTLMEDRALRMARQADQEIASGRYRGPLHGIPTGVKDLFSVKGYPTQWGTAAFRDQQFDFDSAVVEKLDRAGAVIVAKLSLGALAMDNKWFGGATLNPWNPKEGSSGSSAGSAAAVAAGLLPFAIGTETSGSIVSPCNRCRVSGLRTTLGSVSRFGAMALSWSMDKVGPICRTIEDAALVFAALIGPDDRDATTVARPFVYRSAKDVQGWKVGVVGKPDQQALDLVEKAGAELAELELPTMLPALGNIIGVESAAMFDEITRSGRINLVENEWPQYFRATRFVPAVEYIQAERVRAKLAADWDRAMAPYDAIVMADGGGAAIYPANLCGLPQTIIPFGTHENGTSRSVSFLVRPYQEAKAIQIADVVQRQTEFHRLRPDLSPFR